MTKTEENVHGAEISHPAHLQHKLHLVVTDKFRCDGCMLPGLRKSYRCEPCNYDIHIQCAPPETSFEHPLLKCKLEFLLEPPGRRHCVACGDQVIGFMYFNRQKDVDLHPQCAFLPDSITQEGIQMKLHTNEDVAHVCHQCRQQGARRNKFWSYRARVGCTISYVHVGCAMGVSGTGSEGQDGRVANAPGQSEPPPKGVFDSPGNSTWYEHIWKFTKLVAKLGFYILSCDPTGFQLMYTDIVDFFE